MKKSWLPPIIITALIILTHLIYFALKNNYEFLGYTTIILALFAFLIITDKAYNYPLLSIYLLSIWAALHSLGGSIYIKNIRLFDIIILPIAPNPYSILKYDQIAHTFAFFTIAILTYTILKKYIKPQAILISTVIIAASGIGALYEVVEFAMVILFDAGKAVGGYYNTALDLVFNLIGAVFGTIYSKQFLK